MKKVSLAMILLIWTSSVWAAVFMPTPGAWWNPQESGRGIFIDYQDNIMVVSTYVYDQNGAQIWYISSGIYDEHTATFSSTFDISTNGQCFGCAYKAPTTTSGAGGPIKIVFSSWGTGTLYFNGGSTPIQRMQYAFDPGDKNTYFNGEWSVALESLGKVTGQWIIFTGMGRFSDGTPYAVGHLDGKSSVLGIAWYDPTQKVYVMGVPNDGTGLAYLYMFTPSSFDENHAIGAGVSYLASGSPGSTTFPAVAFRLLGKSELLATAASRFGAPKTMTTSPTAEIVKTPDAEQLEILRQNAQLLYQNAALDAQYAHQSPVATSNSPTYGQSNSPSRMGGLWIIPIRQGR
jgi:hypothetical protein